MSEFKESCLTHYARAHKRFIGTKKDLDVLFYSDGLRDIWTAFEAFMSFKGFTGRPWIKIRDFSQEAGNVTIFSNWNRTTMFSQSIVILKRESPVKNEENGKLVYLNNIDNLINNIDNLREVLVFTYAPRGNQIHGAKDVTLDGTQGQRNRNLIEHSFKVVHEILQLFLQKEGLI